MEETQYYLIEHKIEKNRMPVLVRAYEVGNMKRKWTIIGPSDSSGNLIEGAVAKSIPQNEESGAGAGAVGAGNTLNTGTEESREKAAKTWAKPKHEPIETEAPAAASAPVDLGGGLYQDGPILMAEPDLAPQPEPVKVEGATITQVGSGELLAEGSLIKEGTLGGSQAAAEVDAAVSEPAKTPLPREVRKEVKLTDQLPPDDAAKEAQARAAIKPAQNVPPAPAAEEKPANTTRRRAPRTPNTNS